MFKYVIEHRSVVYGKRELPLIAVLGEVTADSAKEANALVKARYRLTTPEEIIHVRRV